MQRFEDAETRALRGEDPDETTLFRDHDVEGPGESTLGRYQILEELGRGGMGVVYRARDPDLQRTVAIKILRSGPDADEDRLRRFQIEARAAASLSHPNLVAVHEVGSQGDRHFLAMDLIEGSRLADVIPRDGMDPMRAARILASVARAAHAAHEGGIVHRDLKPGNIILDRADEPHVTDFGLAKAMGSTTRVTAAGLVMGTPEYMAPEQIDPETGVIDPRTDVYALGAMLYEMVTGHTPFEDPELRALLARIVYGDPLPPRRRRASLPADLQAVILKALAREQTNRYQSAEALAQDLECYMGGLSVSAQRLAPFSTLRRLLRRRRETVAVGLIFVVLLGALVTVGLRRRMHIEEISRLKVEVASLSTRSPQDAHIPELLERLRELEGATAQEALLRGRWHHAAGLLELALQALEEGLELEPDHLPTLEFRAPLLLERERELEVELDWLLGQPHFEARPLRQLAQPRRSQLALVSGQATADLATIARLHPAHPMVAVHRVRRLQEGSTAKDQLEEALEVLGSTPGPGPPPVEVELYRVRILEQLGREEEALRALDAVVTRTESRTDCVQRRAQHWVRRRQWEAALQDLAVLLSHAPQDAAALRCQAICQIRSKRHPETYETFRILGDLFPEDADCQWNAADAARRANQLPEADQLARHLIELSPTDLDAHALHIRVLHLMGLHQQASEELACW